jgi:hypothetical protein
VTQTWGWAKTAEQVATRPATTARKGNKRFIINTFSPNRATAFGSAQDIPDWGGMEAHRPEQNGPPPDDHGR